MPTDPTGVIESSDPFERVLARASARDRAVIEKHMAFCDGEAAPGHARLWRRLITHISSLVPLPVQMAPQAAIFFVADGRYRLQVFALEDRKDGFLTLYLPDVLADALAQKILVETDNGYGIPAGPRTLAFSVNVMDAQNTPDPAQHYKHMIGWNRKALRLTLNAADEANPQVKAAEAMCSLAAKKWADAPASAPK